MVLPKTDVQKVVIVNGSIEVLNSFEAALGAGHYDVIVVESSNRAYSQIKRMQPDLVILCLGVEDADGFRVLSMLKLDEDTRRIPILTYTTEYERQDTDSKLLDRTDGEMAAPMPARRMN